jgi:hypothetical protein
VIVFSSSKLPVDHQRGPCTPGSTRMSSSRGPYDEWVAMVDDLNVYWLKGG